MTSQSIQHETSLSRAAASPLWSLRWRAVRQIALQEFRDAVFGWPLYIASTVSLLFAVLLVYNSIRFVAESGLQILGRPLFVPLVVTVGLIMLYVLAWATLAIARPRDQGALRVLFFAPVDAVSVIGGHLLAGLALYVFGLLLTVPMLGLMALFVNLPFTSSLLLGVLISPVFAAAIIALGLFLSSIATSGRSAMFYFVGVVLLVLAVQVGYGAVGNVAPSSKYYDALRFLRDVLRTVRDAVSWVSPFALLSEGLAATVRADTHAVVTRTLAGLTGCILWLGLAVWSFTRRGVLP